MLRSVECNFSNETNYVLIQFLVYVMSTSTPFRITQTTKTIANCSNTHSLYARSCPLILLLLLFLWFNRSCCQARVYSMYVIQLHEAIFFARSVFHSIRTFSKYTTRYFSCYIEYMNEKIEKNNANAHKHTLDVFISTIHCCWWWYLNKIYACLCVWFYVVFICLIST